LTGVEITEDMPRLSTETAIERIEDNFLVVWRDFDAGFSRITTLAMAILT
jgi:hypothetical protein